MESPATPSAFDFSLDPFENFKAEFERFRKTQPPEPTAVILSTGSVNSQGQVETTARTVLLKSFDDGVFRFFTNYNSQKAKDIELNPKVCLLFYWPSLFQQVRVEGFAQKSSRKVSEDYFASRPRLSQIGAWASRQSQTIFGPQQLSQWVDEVERKYPVEGEKIPCPPHWGGFDVKPEVMEFWFGREGRLHDRYVYQKLKTSNSNHPVQWSRFMKSP